MDWFDNPSKNLSDVYINRQLIEDLENKHNGYKDLKYQPENIEKQLEQTETSDYVVTPRTTAVGEEVQIAENYDSFTAPEVLQSTIKNSDIVNIDADIDQGLYNVQTYTTAPDGEGWSFWIAYMNDASGEMIGNVTPPYREEEHTFRYNPVKKCLPDVWMDDEIMDSSYILARETIPEVKDYSMENKDQSYFKGQFEILENNLGLLSELEDTGEVKVNHHAHTGNNGFRGGSITMALRGFINDAKKGGLLSYTVSNDNKNNKVEIDNGGHKFLTKNLSTLGFSNSKELIDSRLIPAWRKD